MFFFSCLDFSFLRFYSSQQRQEQQPGGERPGKANANVANVLLYKGNACERRRGRCRASTKKKTAQITNTNKMKLDWKKLLECWNYSGKNPVFYRYSSSTFVTRWPRPRSYTASILNICRCAENTVFHISLDSTFVQNRHSFLLLFFLIYGTEEVFSCDWNQI